MDLIDWLYQLWDYTFLVTYPIIAILGIVAAVCFIRWLCYDMRQPSAYEIVLTETPSDTETALPSLDPTENKR